MRTRRSALVLLVLSCLPLARPARALTTEERHARVVRALEWDALGEPERAAKLLRSAVWKAGPEEDSLRLLLARVLARSGTIEGRREAVEIYRKLLFHRPDDAGVRRELAALERRRGFRRNARTQYEQILRRNPGDLSAAYDLSAWYAALWKRTWSDDQRARARAFARWAAAPDTAEAAKLLYAEMLQESDSLAAACAVLQPAAERGSRDPRIDLLLASCLYRSGRLDAADSVFHAGIARLPADVRRAYDDLSPFGDSGMVTLASTQLAASDSLTREAIWRDLDPTAATKRNERRLEQWDRVLWSDLLFSDPDNGTMGWDTEPGAAWIRFGRPQSRDFFIATTMSRTGGQPSRWIWTYVVDSHRQTLEFDDRMYNGRFTLPWVNGVEGTDQVLAFFMGRREWFAEGEGRVFPLVADGGVVFAADGRPWLAVGTGITAPSETTKKSHAAASPTGPFVRDVAVLDMLRREQTHYSDSVGPSREWLAKRGVAARADSIPLPPGRHLVAMTMRDVRTGAHGDAVMEVDVPPRAPGALALSDVILGWWAGRGGAPAELDAVLSRPNGYAVIPNPLGRVAEDDHLYVYVEIYRAPRTSEVTITYSIAPERTKRRLFGRSPVLTISNSVREVVRNDVEPRALDIDVSKLDEGRYTLTLSVHDETTGQTAASTTHFEKEWLDEPDDPWDLTIAR